ncbi:hypothetical protein LTR09_004201 [Extremus antarcticus]|uniref:Uncharacterized protein n=1 Tax=Extremus antarcticus TaxID=702011 RepID=A0AAJ0DQN6_9PEZI|nr:hypothetical protein LTR09_004201 [Extremus antarcticus]
MDRLWSIWPGHPEKKRIDRVLATAGCQKKVFPRPKRCITRKTSANFKYRTEKRCTIRCTSMLNPNPTGDRSWPSYETLPYEAPFEEIRYARFLPLVPGERLTRAERKRRVAAHKNEDLRIKKAVAVAREKGLLSFEMPTADGKGVVAYRRDWHLVARASDSVVDSKSEKASLERLERFERATSRAWRDKVIVAPEPRPKLPRAERYSAEASLQYLKQKLRRPMYTDPDEPVWPPVTSISDKIVLNHPDFFAGQKRGFAISSWEAKHSDGTYESSAGLDALFSSQHLYDDDSEWEDVEEEENRWLRSRRS